MNQKNIIEVYNLSKKYRKGTIGISSLREEFFEWKKGKEKSKSDFWALKNISFSVKKGDVIGLIGKNGSGKSTLLKILSQITEPSTGTAKINGKVASLLEVGTGFHPELTGLENIYLNGAILGMNRREISDRLDDIIEFAGIEEFIETPIKRYSTGMNVRLGFAVAAHLEPDVLIVDEVLAVGDANFQKHCIKKMRKIAHTEGRTIIFVSHNMAMIENLCNQAVLLDQGKIKSIGQTKDVIGDYLEFYDLNLAYSNLRQKGTGELKINSCKIFNSTSDKELTSVKAGEPFKFVLEVVSKKNFKAFDPLIVIELKNSSGTPVFIQHNLLHDYHLDNLQNQNMIFCNLHEFPFPSDRYFIDFRIIDNGKLIYENENAFQIVVEDSDFFGSGEIPEVKYGVAMVRASWGII